MTEPMVENGRALARWKWVEAEWPEGTKAQREQHNKGLHLLKKAQCH